MMYRIHFTLADGTEDSIVVSGGSIDAIRKRADEEISIRGGRDPWSEEVS
jgi:hypothetical protein